MRDIGFRRLFTDQCIYVKGTPNSSIPYTIILLYVDDIIVMSNEQSAIDRAVDQLRLRFKMKDFGTSEHILGTEVYFDHHIIFISQRNYALQLLKKHGYMDDKKISPRQVPMSPSTRLSKYPDTLSFNDQSFMIEHNRATLFCEIMGALL